MIREVKMKQISKIIFILFIIIKFNPQKCQEISVLQNDEKIDKNELEKVETSTLESLKPILKAPSEDKNISTKDLNQSQLELLVLSQEIVFNKSIEYLIEEPNNSNSSHNQEVIFKPLNDFTVDLKSKFTNFNGENEQKLVTNLTDMKNQTYIPVGEYVTNQTNNFQKENSVEALENILTQSPKVEVTTPVYEGKEELIINLLSPIHNNMATTSVLKELTMSSESASEKQNNTAVIKESKQILEEQLFNNSTMTSNKIGINPLKKILKFLTKESATLSNNQDQDLSVTTTESQSIETVNMDIITPTHVKNHNESENQYKATKEKIEAINSNNSSEPITISSAICKLEIKDFSNQLAVSKPEQLANQEIIENSTASLLQTLISSPSWASKSEKEKMTTVSIADQLANPEETENSTVSLLQTLISSKTDQLANPEVIENSTVSLQQTLVSPPSKSEEDELTTKPLTTLEDYAVKQMNFILDHILLESQEFVAKVLQATGSTTFQRDHLKRYAETINRLLNPQLESDYSDDISDFKPVTNLDLYEKVVKKLNFIKSETTKQLQKHLPADWIKDYKFTKEELKIWLDKSSNEMHREFNLYLDEEEDHIKYLYFNEAFDDITSATEIHQKLALLADLIKIVKNKKQITFMDLYMQ